MPRAPGIVHCRPSYPISVLMTARECPATIPLVSAATAGIRATHIMLLALLCTCTSNLPLQYIIFCGHLLCIKLLCIEYGGTWNRVETNIKTIALWHHFDVAPRTSIWGQRVSTMYYWLADRVLLWHQKYNHLRSGKDVYWPSLPTSFWHHYCLVVYIKTKAWDEGAQNLASNDLYTCSIKNATYAQHDGFEPALSLWIT
jgi:hypothetical protein